MSYNTKLRHFIQSDWMIGIFLLLVFLATNGYIYGWDDQHLEIPHLKSLIDQELYPGDYYVQTLKSNFPSFFYHVLAKLITISQIPAVYLLLYLLSRYFLFFWMYKLWHHISGDKFSGIICVLTLILMGRVEEFLYRSFSHQEFALAAIMASIYFFYKKRFILTAVILGIVANIHAVYSLFIMVYMCFYLLLHLKKYQWSTLLKSCLTFVLFGLPFIIRIIERNITNYLSPGDPLLDDWIRLYYIACPQNFIFQDIPLGNIFQDLKATFRITHKYFILIGLYFVNFFFHDGFRKDHKIQIITISTVILLLISFVFTYIIPSKFMIDLNLIRNIQYLLFFLTGYTTILIINNVKRGNLIVAPLLVILFALIRFNDLINIIAIIAIMLLLIINKDCLKKKIMKQNIIRGISICFLIVCFGKLIHIFTVAQYNPRTNLTTYITIILLCVAVLIIWRFKNSKFSPKLKQFLIVIPLLTVFVNYCYFHVQYLRIINTGIGFWQIQRNWIDMQKYVRDHTPKKALLLVPHDTEMGGFRIHSERTIVCSYRDVGLIGFDYSAAVEWLKRKKDIEPFKVYIKDDIQPAIHTAIMKYKVNYIVFMIYSEPPASAVLFEKIYSNTVFSLYRVRINPVNDST